MGERIRPRIFGMISTAASEEYTAHALASFFEHTDFSASDRFILIDNDNSLSDSGWIINYPRISVVHRSSPGSFAENANSFIAESVGLEADLFILNNDIIFTHGWYGPLVAAGVCISIPACNQNAPLSDFTFSTSACMTIDQYLGNEQRIESLARTYCAKNIGKSKVLSASFFCVRIPLEILSVVGQFDLGFGVGGGEDDDYCLRATLQGFSTYVIRNSWLLHFEGRSTWRGPENPVQTKERDERYISAFRGKWGEGLLRAYVYKDSSGISQDPKRLCLAQNGFIREVLGDIEPKVAEHAWVPRVAAVCCVYEDDRWLPQVLESTYSACDVFFFLVNHKPWNGVQTDENKVINAIENFPDPDGKFEIIRGTWDSETEQRNFGLDILRSKGIEFCFVLDADEVYEPDQLVAMLALAANRREVHAWRVPLQTYWKSVEYRIEPPEEFCPATLLQANFCRFVDKREIVAEVSATMPRDLVCCHHLSYARTDQEVLRKLETFSHFNQVVSGWYEKVWQGWDANPNLENLNPCWPTAYRRAIRIAAEEIPLVLRPCIETAAQDTEIKSASEQRV